MIEEKGRMIFTPSKVDDDSTRQVKFQEEIEEDMRIQMEMIRRMKMKVKRIALFDSSYNVNGFITGPGTILGRITNKDKELSFFIKHTFYTNGCQMVYAKPEDIIKYGVENFKVHELEKDHLINRTRLWGERFTPINLIMDVEEWCSLLSERQLEIARRNYEFIISILMRESDGNGFKTGEILSYINAIDNELESRK